VLGKNAAERARWRHLIESMLLTSGEMDLGRVVSMTAFGDS